MSDIPSTSFNDKTTSDSHFLQYDQENSRELIQALENAMKVIQTQIDLQNLLLEFNSKLEIANREITHLKIEKSENEKKFKEEIDQLRNENKRISDLYDIQQQELNNMSIKFNKKIENLALDIEQFTFKRMSFISIQNKWKGIDTNWNPCCSNKCINTNKPFGKCINRNGFIELRNENIVKYNECEKGEGVNKKAFVYPSNQFNKPKNDCITCSLFYYEVKCQIENNYEYWMEIGVHINNIFIRLHANEALIHYGFQSKEGKNFKINKFVLKNNDILGCGLVYPPTILSEKLPYVFFTQNGKQIGKAVLLNPTNGIYEPYIALKCCSVETNFGNDLNSNPFNYSISKHFLAEEFFE